MQIVVAWSQELWGVPQGTFGLASQVVLDENVLYLDCGGCYKIVYFCRNFLHRALKTGDMIKVRL